MEHNKELDIEEVRNVEKQRWVEDRNKFNLIYPAEEVIRLIKRSCKNPKNSVILDFGCGSGRNIRPMIDMKFKKIIAVDYNEECLQLAKNNLPKYESISYIQNTRLQIPMEDNSVDCMVAWGVLFYFTQTEREEFTKEIYRVLKPNGILIADYRGMDDNLYDKGEAIGQNLYLLDDRAGSLSKIVYWFCNDKDLKKLYESNGFIITTMERKVQYVNNLSEVVDHYYIIAKKY